MGRNTEALKEFQDFGPISTVYKKTAPTDIIIVAVADDAVEIVLGDLDPDRSLIVHISGSLPMHVLFQIYRLRGFIPAADLYQKKRDKPYRRTLLY